MKQQHFKERHNCEREYPDCGSPHVCDMCYQLSQEEKEKDNYLKCIEEIAQYISRTKHGFSFQKRYAILDIIEKHDKKLGLHWKADVRN